MHQPPGDPSSASSSREDRGRGGELSIRRQRSISRPARTRTSAPAGVMNRPRRGPTGVGSDRAAVAVGPTVADLGDIGALVILIGDTVAVAIDDGTTIAQRAGLGRALIGAVGDAVAVAIDRRADRRRARDGSAGRAQRRLRGRRGRRLGASEEQQGGEQKPDRTHGGPTVPPPGARRPSMSHRSPSSARAIRGVANHRRYAGAALDANAPSAQRPAWDLRPASAIFVGVAERPLRPARRRSPPVSCWFVKMAASCRGLVREATSEEPHVHSYARVHRRVARRPGLR